MFALIEYWNGGYNGRVLGIYTTKEAAKAAMPMDYTDVQEEVGKSSSRTRMATLSLATTSSALIS